MFYALVERELAALAPNNHDVFQKMASLRAPWKSVAMDNHLMQPEAWHRKQTGGHGEKIAERYLRSIGYHIRGRNVRLRQEEIDLIAFDPVDHVLAFVEVKTRSEDNPYFRPEMNLDGRKRAAIKRAARRYVECINFSGGYRLDLIGVVAGKVDLHIKELDWN